MKFTFIYFITLLAFNLISCDDNRQRLDIEISARTRIISQTIDSLDMQYIKDTTVRVVHENKLHDVPVMQFRIENNSSKAIEMVLTKYNWIASGGTTRKYLNGSGCTDITDHVSTKLVRVDAHSSESCIYPKEDSLQSLTLTIHYFIVSHEESKYKEVVIEFGK